jgi:hypothetical protein
MKNEMQKTVPSAASLNVLVVYDQLYSGIKAKDFCDRLTQQLEPARELRLSFWSLSALHLPPLAQAAEQEASETFLLLLAVNGEEMPSPSVKSWISRCLRGMRVNGGALVAQLHGILRMNLELSPAYKCLKHIADGTGMDFFSQVIEPASEALDNSIKSIHTRAHLRSPVLDAILKLP